MPGRAALKERMRPKGRERRGKGRIVPAALALCVFFFGVPILFLDDLLPPAGRPVAFFGCATPVRLPVCCFVPAIVEAYDPFQFTQCGPSFLLSLDARIDLVFDVCP